MQFCRSSAARSASGESSCHTVGDEAQLPVASNQSDTSSIPSTLVTNDVLLVLRDMQAMPFNEICNELNLTASNVRTIEVEI